MDLHGPLDGCAFRHCHIALVAGVHAGQTRVGRRRGLHAQVGQRGHSEGPQGVVHRPPTVGQKLKVNVVSHGRESVPEHMGLHAFHPEAAVAGLQGHRGRQFVAFRLQGDDKSVPCRNLQPVVHQHEVEWSWLNEFGPVLHDSGGGGGHPIGLHPHARHHQCGDGCGPPQHSDGAGHVHRTCEGQWPKRRGALVDARRQQRDVGTLGVVDLALKLKGVQQLVLDLGKVIAHDAGGLVMAQPLAEACPLRKGPKHLRGQHHGGHGGKRVKQHCAPSDAKPPHSFKKHKQQRAHRQGDKRQQKPSKDFGSVVPADEGVQFLDQ